MRSVILYLTLAYILCLAGILAADDLLSVTNGSAVTPAEPASKETDERTEREAIAERLRVAQRTLESAKESLAEKDAQPPERLQREVELLKQLDVFVAQLEAAKAYHTDLQTSKSDLQGQLESVRAAGPAEDKPYSFLLLDHLRDELTARQARGETLEASVGETDRTVAQAKDGLAAKDQALRRAKELSQASIDEAKKPKLESDVKLASLEARITSETYELRKQERANELLAREIHEVQIDLLKEKVKWVSADVRFSERDLQDQMVEVERREAELRRSIENAQLDLQYAEQEWSRSRHELDSAMEKRSDLREQVEAKQLARQSHQQNVAVLNLRLQRLGKEREIWNRRYQVITGRATTDELIEWSGETQALLKQLDREKRLRVMRIDEVRRDIAGLDKKLESTNGQSDQYRRWVVDEKDHLATLIQTYDSDIISIETARQLAEKLLSEIEGDIKSWSFADWLAGGWHYVSTVWNTELTKVDENPVTIGKIVMGFVLLFCGFVISRMLSRTLGQRLARFGMNESGTSALQSLSFYVLLVFFTLTALRFVNVPLTMFTFLGGAIAIGVGFGSQNILNNFISGLILLAERPIKVGDLIQLDDLYGTVQHIGARSTQIRTGNNLDIIVPNSKFLETNVVNLTLGDDRYRTQVNLGVVYGSQTREVTRLLKHAAVEHGRVLDRPEPFVWFSEFGDNALLFELHFWVKVRTIAERRRIESDLRYRIDQLFRDAGLVIAFPQRDVHLDAQQPISIRMLPADFNGEMTKKEVSTRAA